MTVADAWGHFQDNELYELHKDRSATTIDRYLEVFKRNILPDWMAVPLDEVKTVKVEKWLRDLDLANGTKAKIRNTFCILFNHCIRHELYDKNPISGPSKGSGVRQSGLRRRDPDILTTAEMASILAGIGNEAIKVMVAVAATTGMRRSEVCGLRWSDCLMDQKWFDLKRGIVHNTKVSVVDMETGQRKQESRPVITKLKTKASRKGVPMIDELAQLLAQWRRDTPFCGDDDWVFASPHQNGEWPYNPVPAMRYWVQPAAKKAGCTKQIGWHTYRHSLGSLLGDSGEKLKVVQEILRHASPRITAELYQQADQSQKREALKRFSGLFVMPDTKTA
jgi:integrase